MNRDCIIDMLNSPKYRGLETAPTNYHAHLPCIAILFACGILLSSLIFQQGLSCLKTSKFTFPCLILNFLLSVVFFLRKKPMAATLCLYLSSFFIGALISSSQLISMQSPHYIEEGSSVEWTGIIADEPQLNSFVLRVEKTEQNPARFLAMVLAKKSENTLEYGRIVKVTGKLKKLHYYAEPDKSDYEAYLARKKFSALLDARQIITLGYARVNPIKTAAIKFKKRASSIIDKTFPRLQSGFLKAILLGDCSSLPPKWKSDFSKTGTSHILAISGIHVWMIIGIFFILFQAAGLSRKGVAFASTIVILFYCILVGAKTAVMRASIMAEIILIGKIVNRPTTRWNSLALASIIILAANPFEIELPGFQLSFLAAGGIIYLSPHFQNLFKRRIRTAHFSNKIASGLCPILAAQIAVIPIIAYHFNTFSPIAFIANLVVIPLLGIILALGLTGCTIGFVSITLATIFNKTGSLLISALTGFTRLLSAFPFSHIYVQSPCVLFILIYYCLVIFLLRGWNKNQSNFMEG